VLQSQLRRTITEKLVSCLALRQSDFTVQCYGAVMSEIGLNSDDIKVLVALNTIGNISEDCIIRSISNCPAFQRIFSIDKTIHQFRFSCDIAGYSKSVQWPAEHSGKRRGPDNVRCTVEIIQLYHPDSSGREPTLMKGYEWNKFKTRPGLCSWTSEVVDLSSIHEHKRQTICHQQLTRYLNFGFDYSHVRYTTMILRLMAQSQGIESPQTGCLSPCLLDLFVRKYFKELHSSSNQAEFTDSDVNHLHLAKYVCKRIADFDYRNFVWHVTFSSSAPGTTLRVMHPLYPQYCLISDLSTQATKVIMRVFRRASQAANLEKFIGSG
jgi:hypothetical protein